jgi:hypothetical protein
MTSVQILAKSILTDSGPPPRSMESSQRHGPTRSIRCTIFGLPSRYVKRYHETEMPWDNLLPFPEIRDCAATTDIPCALE